MIRKYFLFLYLIIVASGCATYSTGPLFQEAPIPNSQKSTVYIFQVKSPLVYTPTVRIDGKPFAKLTKMGYSYGYLASGIHRLTFEYGGFDGAFISEIEIQESKEVFLGYYASGYEKRLWEMPKSQALEELKEYRYVEPINKEF